VTAYQAWPLPSTFTWLFDKIARRSDSFFLRKALTILETQKSKQISEVQIQ
jgi:hypothetical protein